MRTLRTLPFAAVTAAAVAVMPALADPSALIRADSAIAGSQFSGSYDIGNAIDGSGLPADFGLDDLHGNYAANNHWTTASGAIGAGTAWAEFFFDSPQTLGQFHLWNHRSNGVASNGHYAVTQFDLQLRDAQGNALLTLLDVPAAGTVAGSYDGAVQSFSFAATAGVSSVWFNIDRNVRIDLFGGTGVYTGVAEVAFGAPIPEPGSVALMTLGLLAIGVQLRRRRRE